MELGKNVNVHMERVSLGSEGHVEESDAKQQRLLKLNEKESTK